MFVVPVGIRRPESLFEYVPCDDFCLRDFDVTRFRFFVLRKFEG